MVLLTDFFGDFQREFIVQFNLSKLDAALALLMCVYISVI